MATQPNTRDVVVIGASAGGVEALIALVSALPEDLPASVFIVLHLDPNSGSRLPEVLERKSRLPVRHALHGEAVHHGRVYVAPADNHLMLRPGYLHVARGPKENGHRPSVDALFRSAAAAYGPRVIAVVLTGYLDCGTAGMLSVKARGGVGVAQDPAEAEAPDMPRSAIRYASVDHVAPLADIAPLIDRLVREPAGLDTGPGAKPSEALTEMEGAARGKHADLVCPTCQGVLTESSVEGFQVFRCHVGHAFSRESVATEQAESVERALWAAVRALEESATLTQRIAATSQGALRRRFDDKARTQRMHAEQIRALLLNPGFTRDDATDAARADEGAATGPTAPDKP